MKIGEKRDLQWTQIRIPEAEPLITRIRKRARNLYLTRQMFCSEAVLATLNRSLNGDLTEAQAVTLAAPFSEALGESGCLCGALSGAVMACGLFVANGSSSGGRRAARDSARRLHDAFKAMFGTTCCRVLTRNVRHDKKAHFQQCADLTAKGAELGARLILEKRPDLIPRADNEYLARRESTMGGALRRLAQHFSCRH